MTLTKDSDGSNEYRSRIGLNLYQLPLGLYTMIVEFFPPEMSNISVTASGQTIYLANQATKIFSNYAKTWIKFHQNSKQAPDYIFIDLHGKTTKSDTTSYLIAYGIEGYYSSIDPTVYDNWHTINKNGNLDMNTNIDMGGYPINNLKSPTSATEYLEANFLNKNGDEMKNELSMCAKRITNLAFSRFDYDAANAKYVEDNYVQLIGATSNLAMNNNRITNLRMRPRVHQAGLLHAISPISMKLGQFKGSTPKLQKTNGFLSWIFLGGR